MYPAIPRGLMCKLHSANTGTGYVPYSGSCLANYTAHVCRCLTRSND